MWLNQGNLYSQFILLNQCTIAIFFLVLHGNGSLWGVSREFVWLQLTTVSLELCVRAFTKITQLQPCLLSQLHAIQAARQ